MAALHYTAKLDPFLSLDCALPSTPAQSKERKGSNFATWQHWHLKRSRGGELGGADVGRPVGVEAVVRRRQRGLVGRDGG